MATPVSPEVAVIITRKKALYGRYADLKQWHRFSEIALPDCKFFFLDINKEPLYVNKTHLTFSTLEKFTTFFGTFFAKAQTLHNIGPGDLQQVGPDEVHAVWSIEDQLLFSPIGEIRGGGYYFEIWKRADGDWFMADLRLERTYQKMSLAVQFGVFLDKWFGISML